MVDVTGSTQIDLVNSVRASNSLHGDVLVAEYQSSGKGRLDRTFEAPPLSALLFSLFVTPKLQTKELSWLPLIAGLSVVNAIDACCSLSQNHNAMLKWPNDILIGEKKMAGLIAENIEHRGVVIGIGINVGMNQSELPVDHATSLELEGCTGCDRNELLATILKEFAALLKRFEDGDADLRKEYLERCATINSPIQVVQPGGVVLESIAIGIDETGALILAGGRHVSVGDIVHLRAK